MEKTAEINLSVIGYDPVGYWKKEAQSVTELLEYQNPSGITWINVTGLSNHMALKQLAEAMKIHPLTLEDILLTEQRPKAEEFDEYIFFSMKLMTWNEEPQFDQLSFIVKNNNTLISFQEYPNPLYDLIFKKLVNHNSRIRKMGVDFLAYEIMDLIVDSYFEVLDKMGNSIEEFELRAMDDSDKEFMMDLQKTKQSLMQIRRAVWPLRENISFVIRLEDSFISDDLDPFFKDLQDHVLQIIETVENNRELLEGILDVNLSAISNRMNKIMKVLTMVSTIFIPLTFIAGIYGMNFHNMPELEYTYAYPISIAAMILIALGMILIFKKKKWL
jgi:magnesium transporter